MIGSDDTRFFLRMCLPVDWCLEDPRIEIGAFFTGCTRYGGCEYEPLLMGLRNPNLGSE
jgi:hypothetical protein